MVPSNLMVALSDGSLMLQVIFFAIFFGISMRMLPDEKTRTVSHFFEGMNEVFIKMVHIVMRAAPFFVFCLMAGVLVKKAGSPEQLMKILFDLGYYSLVVLLGLMLLLFIFYPLLATIFSDIKHLIFPESCLCCRRELSKSETHLCFQCTSELPLSYLDKIDSEENAVRKLFLGRLPIELAYAHLRFEKGGASRKILFRIKYKSDRQLAVYFGEEIGKKLLPVNQTQLPDVLIPVPLHHRKEFMRGYNQSEALTEGISTSSGIPQNTKLCSRIRFTETQTKKGRFERWSNLDNVFSISPVIKNYAHIAIVDDVLTTGSTVEQLVLAIRTIHPEVRVSVLTLALA